MNKQRNIVKILFLMVITVILVTFGIGSILTREGYVSSLGALQTLEFLRIKVAYASLSSSDALSNLFKLKDTNYIASGGVNTQAVPVLVYHGIVTSPDDVNVTKKQFRAHMFALKRAGYITIGTADLYRYLRGESSLPNRSIIITFDDGRTDSAYHADPIFKALDYKGVMFAISQFSVDRAKGGRSEWYYLSRADLKQMTRSGRWEIQAHTDQGHDDFPIDQAGTEGHFYSNRLWLANENRLETDQEYSERVRQDFMAVKKKIESVTSSPVTAIAFPFGDFGQESRNIGTDAEAVITANFRQLYQLGFYQFYPGNRLTFNYPYGRYYGGDNYLVRRIDVPADWSAGDLMFALENGQPKKLPYRDNFSSNRGWIRAWSDFAVTDEGLRLKAQPGQMGAATVLDGSGSWRNYELLAQVDTARQNSVYVWVRYQDDRNFAACNFSQEFVHAEQVLDGEKRVIRGYRGPLDFPGKKMEVGVRVHGRILECLLNGKVVLSSFFMDPKLDQGGIGFKTWNEFSPSELLVKSILVRELRSI